MELLELNAVTRTDTGKGQSRTLRREGRLPAVLYGPNTDPVMLSIDLGELEEIVKGGSAGQAILGISVDGTKEPRTAMIKELQVSPLSRDYLHVDFYEVDMKRKINVMVPVTTTGKCIGIEMGGMIQLIRRELEVLCLPGNIPEFIEIDITELNIGDSVHVEDVKLEGDIEIPHDVDFTILTILSALMAEEEVEEDEDELEEGEEGAEEGADADADADADETAEKEK
ncbi:MAG: 50S ribosomal protein L25/general stress protein Ctc [Desulfobacterales bacterium]|nr:50S ribosomal protein L25/general stress protein Ctc [Desulfobacterales bacterium]